MRYQFTQPAPEDSIFHPNLFDASVGKEIDIKREDGEVTKGVIQRAKVSEDGTTAEITIEVPDTSPIAVFLREEMSRQVGPMSMGRADVRDD